LRMRSQGNSTSASSPSNTASRDSFIILFAHSTKNTT
jgi:hypothetical protein